MDDQDDIVERLLTLAGSIMEDAAPVALISNSSRGAAHRIQLVLEAGEAIAKLAVAANVALDHRGADRFG
ncbi:hypothetical protein OF829_12730 [Sphingomonas sp. LB-2]|uniref:hypothetical protein n=1 Tax=Sphingomonas caeni TaxID=2984949 RepID=UPI002230B45F|nr:hypothetical protein [Sphingomonas caeni]MCW3848108.1 hypothetical protein [Sphingomonas caeni]